LVTGAGGFIGARVVDRLLAGGAQVRALALPGEAIAADIDVARADLRSEDGLAAAAAGCDAVVHLAARVGDWGPELDYYNINAEGTRRLCRAAVEARARRFVLVSSVTIYGAEIGRRVCREDVEPVRPASAYSRSKVAAERAARGFAGDLEVVIARPGNVWGAGSALWVETLAGELRRGRVPLIDGGRGDASLAHVDNVAAALVLAARVPGIRDRAYNVNDGAAVTWARYLGDLAAACGAPPPRRSAPRGVFEPIAAAMESAWRIAGRSERPLLTREAVRLLAGGPPVPIDAARADLGFRPEVSYAEGMAAIAEQFSGAASGG
jgi:nucleoside-diphosphate-sugar epimerase